MDNAILEKLPDFLETLGIDESPMGLCYVNEKPEHGFSPKSSEMPTREREINDEVDWEAVFGNFSCAMGHVWLARKKKTNAYFSSDQFGCPGAFFYLGFTKPQTETIINSLTSGIPGVMDGDHYCKSPEELRNIFEHLDPRPAPQKYCLVKPVDQFTNDELPECVTFFVRPESMCGLHEICMYITSEAEVVVAPNLTACASISAWPLHYLQKGQRRAIIGGFDSVARKYFKVDELSFTVSWDMFSDMLAEYEGSSLKTANWKGMAKKIEMSKKR